MVCDVSTCEREAFRLGYCLAHFARLNRLGDVLADKPIRKRARNGEPMAWLLAHRDYDGEGCLIWPFYRDDKGYAAIVTDGMSGTASRVMCIEVHGKPASEDLESAHSCGGGHYGCIHPKHLRWATKKENGEDKSDHGRSIRGEVSHLSKLTEEDVRLIRRRIATGERQKDIADAFNISPQLVSAIKTGQCWTWLDERDAA